MSIFNLKTEFTSKLSKEVILERLHEVTNTTDDDLFVGYINDKGFNIHKKPRENVRNAFMPIFVGTIEGNSSGCTVNITARFNLFAAVFMIIWSLGAVVLPLIIGFTEPLFFLVPLAVIVIFVPLLYFAYYKPAKKSIQFLTRILSK
jgi:hypothetical protein